MSAIKAEQLLEQLNWRYATKQFDPQRKISAADWSTLETALQLSPSSGGLQPWKFIVGPDPAVRAKLVPASYGQPQIVNASHLVVFASKINFGEADVDAHLKNVSQIQGVPVEALAQYRGMLVGGIVKSQDETARNAWARNQTYIALGNLLASAALLGIARRVAGERDARGDDPGLGVAVQRGLAIRFALGRRDEDVLAAGPALDGVAPDEAREVAGEGIE